MKKIYLVSEQKTMESAPILDYNVLAAKEKEAAAKPTFTFPAAITSKRPMKSDKERVSAGLRV